MRAVEAFHAAQIRWTDGGRVGEYGRICEITWVHEFPANAHVLTHATTADSGSKLIRNQQVTSSSLVAGSKIPSEMIETQRDAPEFDAAW